MKSIFAAVICFSCSASSFAFAGPTCKTNDVKGAVMQLDDASFPPSGVTLSYKGKYYRFGTTVWENMVVLTDNSGNPYHDPREPHGPNFFATILVDPSRNTVQLEWFPTIPAHLFHCGLPWIGGYCQAHKCN